MCSKTKIQSDRRGGVSTNPRKRGRETPNTKKKRKNISIFSDANDGYSNPMVGCGSNSNHLPKLKGRFDCSQFQESGNSPLVLK